MSSLPILFSCSGAFAATQTLAPIRSFFNNGVFTFNTMAANACSKFMSNKILIATAFKIFSACHRLKMLRINTASISAKMVKVHSVWNCADNLFIRKSVRWCCLWTISFPTNCKISISSTIFCTNPFPTIITANAFNDFCPKTIRFVIHQTSPRHASQLVSQHVKRVKI